MFQEIQHAYAVLSDPHERRWYDDHREDILRGKGEGGDANDRKVRCAVLASQEFLDLAVCSPSRRALGSSDSLVRAMSQPAVH
jgi:curved DNA-binding protein CbpA